MLDVLAATDVLLLFAEKTRKYLFPMLASQHRSSHSLEYIFPKSRV